MYLSISNKFVIQTTINRSPPLRKSPTRAGPVLIPHFISICIFNNNDWSTDFIMNKYVVQDATTIT